VTVVQWLSFTVGRSITNRRDSNSYRNSTAQHSTQYSTVDTDCERVAFSSLLSRFIPSLCHSTFVPFSPGISFAVLSLSLSPPTAILTHSAGALCIEHNTPAEFTSSALLQCFVLEFSLYSLLLCFRLLTCTYPHFCFHSSSCHSLISKIAFFSKLFLLLSALLPQIRFFILSLSYRLQDANVFHPSWECSQTSKWYVLSILCSVNRFPNLCFLLLFLSI